MSSISRTKPEFAEPAAKNAKPAQSPQLPALPAIPQETDFSELIVSEDLPASVFQVTSPLLMDHVSNVEMDAESAHQPPTVPLALPWQLPAETESAHAHKGPSSLSQPTVLDTALLADLTAMSVLMPAPALLA
jgi:hypothetical protein